MKKIILLAYVCVMAFTLAACASTAENSETENSGRIPEAASDNTGESSGNTDSKTDLENESESQPEEAGNTNTEDSGSNILVAYFSLAGEQYGVGVVEEGNTSIIAHMIAEQTGADLFEIKAAEPYPETYDGLLDISKQEMADNARPEIAGTVENMDDYDTVFVGYPIWWADCPMIIYHFLESYDFSGKTVVPFCTHGGSGLAGTESTIANLTGAQMADGFAISGETAQNDRDRAGQEVSDWLREAGFL